MELFETLEMVELKGELKKKINQFAKYDLLVMDELGYLFMNKHGMLHHLFQLIYTLYEYRLSID